MPTESADPRLVLAQQLASQHHLLLEREEFLTRQGDSLLIGLHSAPPEIRIAAGVDNTVIVGSRTHAGKALITIRGSDNLVVIGAHARLGGGKIELIGDGNVFWFGAQCSADLITAMPREGQSIIIGDDCLFSARTILETSDHHPIFDLESGDRINGAGSIVIGNHVWLGRDVHVAKGATIGAGSVVGSRSTVTGSNCAEPHHVYAGTPARRIREGVDWAHQKASTRQQYKESEYALTRESQREWIASRSIALPS